MASDSDSVDVLSYSLKGCQKLQNRRLPRPVLTQEDGSTRRTALSVGQVKDGWFAEKQHTFSNSSDKKYDPVAGCAVLAPFEPLS